MGLESFSLFWKWWELYLSVNSFAYLRSLCGLVMSRGKMFKQIHKWWRCNFWYFQKDLVIMHTKNIQFKRCRKITLLPICIQEYIDILGALSLAVIYLLVALDSTWYFIEEKEKSHNKFRGFPVNSVWIKKALRLFVAFHNGYLL